MTIDKAVQLFFGVKIDSKMREALAQAKPGDRRYFEDTSGQFLQIVVVGEEKWIGKVIKAGLNVTEVEDIQRNVSSILRRIAPGVRQNPNSVKIFATAPDAAPAEDPKKSSGPYIA